jgi:prepilin-type N-terminal cleavage/methylation domain-containing protein
MRNTRAFTLIEILVVIAIISTLAGMVSVMVVKARRNAERVECIQHVSELVRLLEINGGSRYPRKDGARFVLDVLGTGLFDEQTMELLFCPGDLVEDVEGAGGTEAYKNLGSEPVGHLTSYAGRRQTEPSCMASKTGPKKILICDDSYDHHHEEGIVVGIAGGTAKFREIGSGVLQLGEGSPDEELRCLSVN